MHHHSASLIQASPWPSSSLAIAFRALSDPLAAPTDALTETKNASTGAAEQTHAPRPMTSTAKLFFRHRHWHYSSFIGAQFPLR